MGGFMQRVFYDIYKYILIFVFPIICICTARDILKFMCDKNVVDSGDFNWMSQLRYYWKIDDTGKMEYFYI